MSRNNYWLACGLLCLLLAACSEEDGDGKDLDKPLIESGDSASPLNCQVYRTGEEIPFRYTFTDNDALGSYNIEIHNNFDHHSHSTEAGDCPLDEKKLPVHPWVYNTPTTTTTPTSRRTFPRTPRSSSVPGTRR